jgi:hypothetical protein
LPSRPKRSVHFAIVYSPVFGNLLREHAIGQWEADAS